MIRIVSITVFCITLKLLNFASFGIQHEMNEHVACWKLFVLVEFQSRQTLIDN